MKQSDIFSLILIAGIGTLAAFFACRSLLGDPDKASVTFTKLQNVILSELTSPSPETFNSVAINPTVEVYVGNCEDLDQNGILDEEDLWACGQIEREEKTCEDTNADGFLDEEELTVCEIKLEGIYGSCDTDGDGKLSLSEQITCNINRPNSEEE